MPRSRKSQMDQVIESRDDNGGVAVAEPGEQAEMWPEINTDDPKQRDLLRAAKAYNKAKAERDALLSTSKEKTDGAMQKVIALMHECQIKKFRHKGVEAELIETKEKVEVTIEDDNGNGDEE